ncbi:hypothetical protein Anas_04397 [Armadillidium nasatum]|uniref:Uncharacterized protein n=1 Tax=Armadillidium nasatum TaxID=96803 RepID=A0A5N5TN82_9CRUS|nr:hypothetical protein Anas_04397 [Armadillidium nasatum]
MLLRAFVMAVGNSFVTVRFPGGHFDRLTGIYTSLTTIVIAIQYPFFVWIQNQFTAGNVYVNIHHDFESLSPTSSLNRFLRQENRQTNAFFGLARKN